MTQSTSFLRLLLLGILLANLSLGLWAQDDPGGLRPVPGTEAVHNFGEVDQGAVLVHQFELIVTGDKPVIVTKIKASCGCLTPLVRFYNRDTKRYYPYAVGSPLRPGTKLLIKGILKTDGFAGVMKKRVNVKLRDSSMDFSLGLDAIVRPILDISPNAFFALGNQPSTEALVVSFVVRAPRMEVFDLEVSARGTAKEVTVDLQPLEDPAGCDPADSSSEDSSASGSGSAGSSSSGEAKAWRVHVRIPGPHRSGRRTWMVRLVTKKRIKGFVCGERNYGRTLTIQANITGKVSVQSEYLNFRMVQPGVPASVETLITVHDGVKLKGPLEAIIIPNRPGDGFDYENGLEAIVTLAEDGLSAKVELKLKEIPKDFPGSFSGKLQITLGHPERPVVQLGFSGRVRQTFK